MLYAYNKKKLLKIKKYINNEKSLRYNLLKTIRKIILTYCMQINNLKINLLIAIKASYNFKSKEGEMISPSIIQDLKNTLGDEKIKTDQVALATYASDSVPGVFRKPSAITFPENAEEVRRVLLIANENKIPVTVMSGGINVAALTVPLENGFVIDLRRMDKLHEINTESGYAVIEPGLTFNKFCAALKRENFRCHVTTAPGEASVVGNYLSRPSGTFCTRHLDSIIDLEVVFPDGTIINTGTASFPNAGHSLRYGPGPDITGMFCMSHGTLGIVTKASVRIYPKTEAYRIFFATFDNYDASVKFCRDITLNNISEHTLIYGWRMWMDGLAKGTIRLREKPEKIPYNAVTATIAGYKETVSTNEKVCARLAKKYGGKIPKSDEIPKIMMRYQSLANWYKNSEPLLPIRLPKETKIAIRESMDHQGLYSPWIVMAEPDKISACEKWAIDKITSLGCGVPAYYSQLFDYGRSIFLRLFIWPDENDKVLLGKVKSTYNQMYTEALKRYGATPFRARGISPWLNASGELFKLMKKLKMTFDPNNILQPNLLSDK